MEMVRWGTTHALSWALKSGDTVTWPLLPSASGSDQCIYQGPFLREEQVRGWRRGAEEFRSSMGDIVFESLSWKLSFMSTEKEGMETNVRENGMSLVAIWRVIAGSPVSLHVRHLRGKMTVVWIRVVAIEMERREWFGGVCLGRSDYGCPAQFTYLYPSITRSL